MVQSTVLNQNLQLMVTDDIIKLYFERYCMGSRSGTCSTLLIGGLNLTNDWRKINSVTGRVRALAGTLCYVLGQDNLLS